MTRMAIFASGAGSNAANIIDYFKNHETIAVTLIVCNKPDAGVLKIASLHNIPVLLIEKERFFRGDAYLPELRSNKINVIVLAGFLLKLPASIIEAYRGSIVNIHPALLPAYGGKGMYGMNVHNAVVGAREEQSGITIHFVDEHYDHGDVIFQEKIDVNPSDTPQSLAEKIHKLEYDHFPRVIEQVINLQNQQ